MRTGLTVRVRRSRGDVRIEVRGALTRRTRGRLLDAIWRSSRPGRRVDVDLAGLSYFDSPSLLAVVGTEQLVRRAPGAVVDIVGVEQAVARLTEGDG